MVNYICFQFMFETRQSNLETAELIDKTAGFQEEKFFRALFNIIISFFSLMSNMKDITSKRLIINQY